MSCHAAMPEFADIFNSWKTSGHAQRFKMWIDGNPSYYSAWQYV
jgi:hypothetical protein